MGKSSNAIAGSSLESGTTTDVHPSQVTTGAARSELCGGLFAPQELHISHYFREHVVSDVAQNHSELARKCTEGPRRSVKPKKRPSTYFDKLAMRRMGDQIEWHTTVREERVASWQSSETRECGSLAEA